MDTIGLDLHKRESQLCVLTEAGHFADEHHSSPESAYRRLSGTSRAPAAPGRTRPDNRRKRKPDPEVGLDGVRRFTESCGAAQCRSQTEWYRRDRRRQASVRKAPACACGDAYKPRRMAIMDPVGPIMQGSTCR
jgi:hypothetical protein